MREFRSPLQRVLVLASRLALSIASVGGALAITLLLQPTVFPTPLFFVAVVLSTWIGGLISGISSVVFATLLLEYYFVTRSGNHSLAAQDLIYLAQFSLPALLTCWFVKKRKDAETALRESRDQLDAKVRERTTELRVTNERLQSEIAERRRTEEEHHQTKAELEHVTRISTMSALATSIAHEVNQPLAAIATTGDACLRWLAAEPPNVARAKESASRIISEGNRAGEIVRRIRALSTKTAPQKSMLHLDEMIRDVLSLLNVELRDAGIVLELNLEEKLPAVLGDSVQLQQVVLNLIVNATEAMGDVETRPRKLKISVTSVPESLVCVAVRDNGRGLNGASVERLFETFVTTKPNGIGMGLPISRSIIEAHGGQLVATANEDFGATFFFELPAMQENGI